MRSTTRTGLAPSDDAHAATPASAATQRRYAYIAGLAIILFLASVARFYHSGTGFTALIGFPEDDPSASETLRAIPHHTYPAWASYDGQFYAQRAFDPLIRDPDIDRAMDSAPFRARRILFSWTAWIAGLGRPAWILQAYALQNVVCWLLLAALLTRWLPPISGRGLALWLACLFSHGMLWSVRFSLLDGPSVLLIAFAVLAVERGRPMMSAVICGIAALGRETNLLAIAAQPPPRDRRSSWRLLAALVLAVLPLAIWYDYLRSIYRATLLTGADSFVVPGSGLVTSWGKAASGVVQNGALSGDGLAICLLLAMGIQAAYLFVRRDYASPWWRVAVAYAVLMIVLHHELIDPVTGAITRLLLPMTVGFNVLLARERLASRFWPWFAAGNLHLLPIGLVMPLLPWQ